ncbi:MAG: hypothetical protein HC900_06580 [Methylacidiphilales bacterium]|nr:hypothetical protein [Candidatus Methylacidiphilales bacterium]
MGGAPIVSHPQQNGEFVALPARRRQRPFGLDLETGLGQPAGDFFRREAEPAVADEAAESAEEGDAKTKSAVEAKEQYRKKYEDQYDADEKTSW